MKIIYHIEPVQMGTNKSSFATVDDKMFTSQGPAQSYWNEAIQRSDIYRVYFWKITLEDESQPFKREILKSYTNINEQA